VAGSAVAFTLHQQTLGGVGSPPLDPNTPLYLALARTHMHAGEVHAASCSQQEVVKGGRCTFISIQIIALGRRDVALVGSDLCDGLITSSF
jgi:hypothetical protein